jgi:hypothetical protein
MQMYRDFEKKGTVDGTLGVKGNNRLNESKRNITNEAKGNKGTLAKGNKGTVC